MTATNPISRDDIRSKLGDLQGEAQSQVAGVKNQAVAAGVGIAILVLIVAFVLGRRGGRRSSAVIEVRRG